MRDPRGILKSRWKAGYGKPGISQRENPKIKVIEHSETKDNEIARNKNIKNVGKNNESVVIQDSEITQLCSIMVENLGVAQKIEARHSGNIMIAQFPCQTGENVMIL